MTREDLEQIVKVATEIGYKFDPSRSGNVAGPVAAAIVSAAFAEKSVFVREALGVKNKLDL